MKNWTLLLISFTLYSCVSKDNPPIVEYLCGDSGITYWDVYNPNKKKPAGVERFEKDGSLFYLAYHYEVEPPYSRYRKLFSYDDVISPNCWKYIFSDSICLNGFESKIIKISSSKFKVFSSIDTIKDLNTKEIALIDSLFVYYVKSADQRDGIDFDSLKKANNFYFSVNNDCCNLQ